MNNTDNSVLFNYLKDAYVDEFGILTVNASNSDTVINPEDIHFIQTPIIGSLELMSFSLATDTNKSESNGVVFINHNCNKRLFLRFKPVKLDFSTRPSRNDWCYTNVIPVVVSTSFDNEASIYTSYHFDLAFSEVPAKSYTDAKTDYRLMPASFLNGYLYS